MKTTLDINTWRRRNNRLFSQATSYVFDNYSNMVKTREQYNVSFAEQLEVQCNIPLEVAEHITSHLK